MKKILPGGIYLLLAIGQALAQPCVPTAPMNAVGGQVFYDENGNGLHDGAELWYPGASLRLYADSDSNGIPDAGALQGATTDGNGRYRFDTSLYYTTQFLYDQRIQAGSNDAYEVRSGPTGDVIETTTAVNFGRNHNSNYGAGFRFTGLSLPANAIIDSAFMLIDNALATGNYTTSVNIFGENEASTNTFSDAARIFTRPVTTQSATFGIAWTGGETDVRSPDLSAILQELINSHGAIDDAAFLWFRNASSNAEAQAVAFEGNPARSPRLVVYYTVPGQEPHRFLVDIDPASLPPSAFLTTATYQTAIFNAATTADCGNDFGFDMAVPNTPPDASLTPIPFFPIPPRRSRYS